MHQRCHHSHQGGLAGTVRPYQAGQLAGQNRRIKIFDCDGVANTIDNCTLLDNTAQRDTDGDGFGNACDPDLNNDGVVNFLDISSWVPFFNTACGDVDEDFDGDGGCNFGDYALFPQFFMQPPGPSGIAP